MCLKSNYFWYRNGEKRYPNMVAYELSNILSDLVYFASEYLVLGGRLVFWMPTLNEQYKIIDSDTKKRTFQL